MTTLSYAGAVSYSRIFTYRYDTSYQGFTPLTLTRTTANGGLDSTSILVTDVFTIGDADIIGLELMTFDTTAVSVTIFDEYIVGDPAYSPPRVFLRPLGKVNFTTANNGSYGRSHYLFRRPNSLASNPAGVATPAIQGALGLTISPSGRTLFIGGATGITSGITSCPLPSRVYFAIQNTDVAANLNILEYSILVFK